MWRLCIIRMELIHSTVGAMHAYTEICLDIGA